MDRDQITSRANDVLRSIVDAYSAVERMENALADAARATPSMAVVYGDIRQDACLPKLRSDLNGLHDILDSALSRRLPAHFERLKPPEPRIVTTFVHPPIPIRSHDWCACIDGTEEDGPYGWGATEAEAIADLQEQLDD